MQAIMETIFDVLYLTTVISVGVYMMRHSGGEKQYRLFGIMAVLLGSGDAFHLVPRCYALFTTGLQANAATLGFGKLVTSVTMTVFYMILYHIWRERYQISGKKELTITLYALAAVRIALCLMPQNAWLSYDAPLSWGIYRNIPFAILGIIIIVLFYNKANEKKDTTFKFMWLAIVLSFAFYIPVVLFSGAVPIVGILMIPKTLAYVWIVIMGYQSLKQKNGKKA